MFSTVFRVVNETVSIGVEISQNSLDHCDELVLVLIRNAGAYNSWINLIEIIPLSFS